MRKESFEAAQPSIKEYFSQINEKAFTTHDLSIIFENKRFDWKIAAYRNSKHFIKFLADNNILNSTKLKHQVSGSIKTILSKRNGNFYDIALTIKKDGYLSNYTAMAIHELTLQIPKSIYISFLKSDDRVAQKTIGKLSQDSIDKAFSKKQRQTSEIYKSEKENYRIYLIQKNFTLDNVGVITKNGLRYTDLERTLIDIAIRPAYSGGVFEVLDAFSAAKEKVDLVKLERYLNTLDYTYPYHQLIGFYLNKANYNQEELRIFQNKITNYNFYLTYNISNKEFDQDWKIFYPKGF
ncbi:type IV toxin-antitoxin system AbiEi family antitoxin domain-containing protein [Salegentibacter mishustinae]|uniref:Uncharacterized protein n=1 Tax=Salegentibacter mishustinae TaxID=270918 RepID=A0A0Q9ZCA0_9FLAO|nr:hypothetical protein [Salegentibacter mishustinae]KRG30701.1 hypothetical protein APR42_02230 [Salegentibacter mishustinae]PNW23589.1 hypothetical protein APB85_02225 [Salegentibacter mishustinae]PZX66674.1 hypothetical protein LY54_01077 [Salegentibacter mishustinae]GGW83869.1 hypothetical protein GCM10008086_10340 [Salegentibacter mishustinae]